MTESFERQTIVPIASPRDGEGNVDQEKLHDLFMYLYQESGIQSFFVLGTTGRFYELSDEEKDTVLQVALEVKEHCTTDSGPPKLMVGVIEETKDKVAAAIEKVDKEDIDAVIFAPAYLKEDWTVDDAMEILDSIEHDVVLYDLPAGVGETQLDDGDLRELLQHPKVVAFKDSNRPSERLAWLTSEGILERENVKFYFGDETAYEENPGGDGVVCGNANVAPVEARTMVSDPTDENVRRFREAKQKHKLGGANFRKYIASVERALEPILQ